MKNYITILALYALFLLPNSIYGTNDSARNNSKDNFEKIVTEKVMSLPFSYKDTSIRAIGLLNRHIIYYDNKNNSLNYFNGAESFTIENNYKFEVEQTVRFPLNNSIVLIDTSNHNSPYILYKEKENILLRNLPQLPIRNTYDKIYFTEYENIIYSCIRDNENLNLYSLHKGNLVASDWENLSNVKAPHGNCLTFAFQNNGSDKCLYIFAQENSNTSILNYNLRLKKWTRIEPPVQMQNRNFNLALNKGAAHIILLSGTDNKIGIYHTITNSFYETETHNSINKKLKIIGSAVSDNNIYETILDDNEQSINLYALNFKKSKNGFAVPDIVVIILYFLALVSIGIYFSKRQKNSDDYFKGGQRIPWWAAGLSLFGTALSAITFMAIPAKSFATDWSYMLFNIGIVLVAPIIMFVFIPFFRKLNITTAYQYLEVRFNSLIRVICSLAFIIFQIGRMGVVLFLPSIAINIVTGIDIFLCIALMGVFSIIYTRMGGIEAVVWTDALQVVILLGGAIFAIFHIVAQTGIGWSETLSVAYSNGKFNLGDTGFDLTNSSMWTVLIATFFTNLTTYGTDQSMVQRYLTTSSQREAQKSVLTNALLTIPATIIFFLIGTVLFVYYKTMPEQMSVTMENADAIFPLYIYSNLPAGITGLLISGIFAAAMSTLSGSMNSAATAYVIDIRPKLFKRKGDANLKVAKTSTLIVGLMSLLFAFLMATWNINSLWDEFNKILGLILGSMGGLFMLGMITKRANSSGALCGMIVSVIVQFIVTRYTATHLLLYTTVGFISCFVVGYIASFFFSKKQITNINQ